MINKYLTTLLINFKLSIGVILLLGTLSSCEDYLGEETDLGFIEVPQQTFREVAYVPVQPILNQFVFPTDIIAGFDELIYVVDQGTQEVIVMDESGVELGRKFIQGAKAIAQDRKLNLLVIGTATDESSQAERSCIYRLNLNTSAGYGLANADITDSIIHPFYFKTTAVSADEQVVFNRISVLADNSFYVTRTGPNNSSSQSGGPDNSVLLFNDENKFVTPIVVSDNRGAQFPGYFNQPFAISTTIKPPQLSVVDNGGFLFTSLDPSNALKVQFIEKLESPDGVAYTPRTDWNNDTSEADSFINEPFKFEEPVGVEISGDGSNFIFVVDRKKDSLYQFTSTGLEGVQPPPASGETKYVNTSFGGTGIGATQFNNPMAVAYNDQILYVADAGNGRVLRFKLTLDIR
ncbi:MAG: hypothetical protein RJQ00_04190 [Vicingaceae bacterium]